MVGGSKGCYVTSPLVSLCSSDLNVLCLEGQQPTGTCEDKSTLGAG